MVIKASTSVDISLGAVPRYIFPFLKDAGGTISSAVTSAIGAGNLIVGDVIETGRYYADGNHGGNTYEVVAAATGTDDGGSFIDAASLQLQALFPGAVIDVQQFGARGDGVTDDLVPIQAALSFADVFGVSGAAYGNLQPTKVLFPASEYSVSTSVSMSYGGDGRAGVVISGGGEPTNCVIHTADDANPLFIIETTTGNLRHLRMENLMLRGGSIGLKLDRVKYCNFDNISFFQQQDVGIEVDNGGNNTFVDLNLNEVVNDSLRLIGGTGDTFLNCQVGEFSGNILLEGCRAHFTGGKFYQAYDRVNPTGLNGMGPATFSLNGAGAALSVVGAFIQINESLLNASNAEDAVFEGCTLEWVDAHDGHLLNIRSNNTRQSAASLIGNRISFDGLTGNIELVKSEIGHALRNCVIANNRITGLSAATLTVDDDLLNPEFGNQVYGNTINLIASS